MSQQVKVTRLLDVRGAQVLGMSQPPGTQLYVDTTLGNDGNAGLGWGVGKALATIGQAMTLAGTTAASPASRGRVQIFVAPGGYTEDIKTPLNATHPFGQLIAFNPTPGQSYGAAYTTATTASVECLQVRARGWYIAGFEFDALADAESVVLGGSTSTNGSGVMMEDCLIVGQNQGLYGIDFQGAPPLVTIRRCGFFGFTSGSTAGKCISCTASGTDQPRFILIEHCWFADSDNLIDMNPRGFKESCIRFNWFYTNGANQNPDEIIDNTGGNDTIIYGNYFPGTYSGTGGYVAGTNDEWGGNFNSITGGVTAADPS